MFNPRNRNFYSWCSKEEATEIWRIEAIWDFSTRFSSDANRFKVVLFVGCHDFSWIEKHQNPNSSSLFVSGGTNRVQLYKALESEAVAPFWPPNTKWRMLQLGRATKLACIEQNNTTYTYTDIRYMWHIRWNVELCNLNPFILTSFSKFHLTTPNQYMQTWTHSQTTRTSPLPTKNKTSMLRRHQAFWLPW